MFVVTNRVVHEGKTGLDVFGREPNPRGPNELRAIEITGSRPFRVKLLDDQLTHAEVEALARRLAKFGVQLDQTKDWFASLRVACEVFERALNERRHVLLFVHGYNNDMADVLRTAHNLERLYNLIVVPFSWPANGGGKVSGAAAYLSDKDDARASATALHRAVQRIGFYHGLFTEGLNQQLMDRATARHPNSPETAHALFVRLVNQQCRSTVNLACHSMGNYLLKYATRPSNSSLRDLVFDNISLVAADVNNPGHQNWVQVLPVRNRLYVTINENDYALRWSRRKPGDAQEERLGHHLRNLTASNAYYIDLTRNRGVGTGHSYFQGRPVTENATLKRLFSRIFEGDRAETSLEYHADINVYRT